MSRTKAFKSREEDSPWAFPVLAATILTTMVTLFAYGAPNYEMSQVDVRNMLLLDIALTLALYAGLNSTHAGTQTAKA